MVSATAEMRHHVPADLRVRRLRILLQQRLHPHHHVGSAVTAWGHMLFGEGALDRTWFVARAQSIEKARHPALRLVKKKPPPAEFSKNREGRKSL